MFDSVTLASLELESSSIEEPEEPSLSTLPPLQSENSFVGIVLSGGDSPLVYNVQGLQSDHPLNGVPLPMHTDCSLDSFLMDESSSGVPDSSYMLGVPSAGSQFGFNSDGDAWYKSLDETADFLHMDTEDTSAGPKAGPSTSPSENTPGNETMNSIKIESSEVSTEALVKSEAVDSEECDDSNSSSVGISKMRLLVDKDDKENSRLLVPNKSEGVVANETPLIAENNGEILNSILNANEVCTISEEPSRDSTTVNSSCVLNSSGSSEHGDVGNLRTEGIAKAIIDTKSRTNPGGNNGQTLAMKSYAFAAPSLVRGRQSNGVVKRIGNGGNAKTVVVEEV